MTTHSYPTYQEMYPHLHVNMPIPFQIIFVSPTEAVVQTTGEAVQVTCLLLYNTTHTVAAIHTAICVYMCIELKYL